MSHRGRRSPTGTQARHALLVAFFYPPSRASGVYRALAMANILAEAGWHVTVLTADRDFYREVSGSTDESLLRYVRPGVTVTRVRMTTAPFSVTDVRLARHPVRRLLAALHRITSPLFPDRYRLWILPALLTGLRIGGRSRVDLVIGTGNPWSALEVARRLSGWWRRPFIADFRDSWTLDQFSEKAVGREHATARAEERIVASADLVTLVNEPMREWYGTRYPGASGRMSVVENGFDDDSVPTPPLAEPLAGRATRFGAIGTVTEHWPHEATWEGWRLLRQTNGFGDAEFHLYGHAGFSPNAASRIRALVPEEAQGISWSGALPRTELSAAYERMDVVVLPIPPSRYVTAGKVYEAMSTGRPIVSIHTAQTAATGPLGDYPLWFPASSMTAEAVRDALLAAASAARDLTAEQREAALQHAQKYRRWSLLQPWLRDLERLANG